MLEITDKYTTGKLEKVWSCETFSLNPYDFYPNWSFFENQGRAGRNDGWDAVNKRYEELQTEKLPYIDICKTLKKEKLILFHNNPKSNVVGGFCKIQGNEFNALLIYVALVELSKIIKHSVIKLSDEGEFLFCPVEIMHGKVKPLISELKENIEYYYALLGNNNTEITSQIDTKDLPEQIINDLRVGKDSSRGYEKHDVIGWINDQLRNVNELYKNIKSHYAKECKAPPFIFNIENTYFPPELLCRPVDPNDFNEMECTPATLMAGFSGSYWGLSSEDEEAESYRRSGMIQSMIGGDNNSNLEILGEKK